MVTLVKKKGNTSTGIHMLQKHGNTYKFRCDMDTLKRLTSVEVKPEFSHIFNSRADGVFHSEAFDSIEEGTEKLIEFIKKVTGVTCTA